MGMNSYVRGLLAGMQLAQRICNNRVVIAEKVEAKGEAANCAATIRIIQVEIGSGRMALPQFTMEEQNELARIR